MRFVFTPLEIPGLVEIEHQQLEDDRGFFAETFRDREFADAGIRGPFVQENRSRSSKSVLRGLHYQLTPRAQGKLVSCVRGSIFDVAVDLRRGSAHYGQWASRILSDENRKVLYIPAGFAHGFLTLSDWADVSYKVTDYYSPEHERGIRWDDPDISIRWPGGPPRLSPKDAVYPGLKEAEHNF